MFMVDANLWMQDAMATPLDSGRRNIGTPYWLFK